MDTHQISLELILLMEKFNKQQKDIYEIVLATQIEVLKNLKPGVTWPQMLEVCHHELLRQLVVHKFIAGDINEMYNLKIHSLFMPHGLGHYVGLEVHDPPKIPVGRLEKNTVVTVEPGCYFLSFLFEEATEPQKKFLKMDEIKKFYNFGGVRIEDDVQLIENGNTILSILPKTIREIEDFMN